MGSKQKKIEAINRRCVHTYLQVLGYSPICRVGDRIFYDSPVPGAQSLVVFHHNNKFQCGRQSGGVIDLAAWLYATTTDQVFDHQTFYKIDQLLLRCGTATGPLWRADGL